MSGKGRQRGTEDLDALNERLLQRLRALPEAAEWPGLSAAELRRFIQQHELTDAETGTLVGTVDRTVRNWRVAGKKQDGYATWFTLQVKSILGDEIERLKALRDGAPQKQPRPRRARRR